MAHGLSEGQIIKEPLKNRLNRSYTQIKEPKNGILKRHF